MRKILIDYPTMNDVIGKAMRSHVDKVAAQIAARVDTGSVTEAEVKVYSDETKNGWPVGTVVIAHPAGIAIQAKHGALTKAAASVGLEVKAKKGKK